VRRGPDRLTLLGPVAARLGVEGIAFAVIGATAMAVHGVARSTLDVDLLATQHRAALVADVDAAVGALPADAQALWARLRGAR
jgi:hypothetical protein